jgi:hypothetical protein
VLHTTISSAPVALRSTEPKLSPATVTELPPLTAEFCSQPDPTAASKLIITLAVPATPPTLTADTPSIVLDALLTHANVVADVHDDVMHTAISSAPVALRSTAPKLSPVTASEAIPVRPVFITTLLIVGASKLNKSVPVPAVAATVAPRYQFASLSENMLHATLVVELHDVVEQTALEMVAVAVRHSAPKPRP